MRVLFVVDRMEDWPYDIPGSSAVTAQDYLTESVYSGLDARVVNLCRCDHYQGRGYYVSLLGEARGHKPMPTVKTIEDLQSAPLVEVLAGEIDELLQDRFQSNADERYELTACFGRDFDEQHAALSQHLFGLVKAPLVRAEFERKDDRWVLSKLRALSAGDLSDPHRQRVAQAATDYVAGFRRAPPVAPGGQRPAVAILHDAAEADAPSNAQALDRFVHAANTLGMTAEIIDRRALERLDDFDGLFIRDTTNVGHYTYEFSRRAAARGLVVMDDPDSILKCTNKVYLNELMARHQIPMPKTVMVHRGNVDQVIPALGLPCILKQPDSAFSLGVMKITSEAELRECVDELLHRSELLIAQEFLPTAFDWRVCVLDHRPLFVCKYYMAPGHWQVIKRDTSARVEGRTVAMTVGEAPEIVVWTALRAANLIGAGLYGVDLKQVGEQCYLIEVNDNPNVDAGNEDQVLQDALYREVMGVFSRRIRERRRAAAA